MRQRREASSEDLPEAPPKRLPTSALAPSMRAGAHEDDEEEAEEEEEPPPDEGVTTVFLRNIAVLRWSRNGSALVFTFSSLAEAAGTVAKMRRALRIR